MQDLSFWKLKMVQDEKVLFVDGYYPIDGDAVRPVR